MKIPHRISGAIALVVIAIPARAVPSGEQTSAASEASEAHKAGDASATKRARFRAGAFVLAHARRPDVFPASMGFAPGLALGGAWRLGAWELGGLIRAAYFREDRWVGRYVLIESSRTALFGSLGGRARWFSAPSASLTPFIDLGVDFSVLYVDDYAGWGPSAHVGAGVEIWHDRPHHRLAIGFGVDVPAYRAVNRVRNDFASWASSNDPVNGDHFWAVPVSLAASWTF